MKYKVSVIIPIYNAENYIDRVIGSVINQTIGFNNIELILVDDNSKDSSRDILRKYSNDFENIKCLFPEGNSGTPGRGRNIGIDNASSEYVMFLDQDDMYAKDICEVLYNVISETKKDIVMCNHKIINNNNFMDIEEFNHDFSYKIYLAYDKKIFNDAYMWNKIFRRNFLLQFNIKCFETYWGEDSYFCIKSYLNTDEVPLIENYKGYIYNVRDSEEDSSSNNSYTNEDFRKYLKGFYKIIGLIKDVGRQDLINQLMKKEFVVILSQFVRLNTDSDSKVNFLNELYKFSEYCNFNEHLDEKWADIIFTLLQRRKFTLILLYSKVLNFIYNSNKIRTIYRNFYDKT